MICGVEADLLSGNLAAQAIGVPGRSSGDERLARQVGSGNERAFTTLFQRYHQPLYRYCRSLTGNDEDAQDALQSALTKAYVALRDGRRNAPVRPWLYRIAHNESISIIRSRGTTVELPAELEAPRGLAERVEERERLALLMADLQDLPERQRGALVMRELNGFSHEEIAQALEVSPGAAKQTILEARRSLMEFEEGRAMACDDVQRVISDNDRRSLRSRRVRAHLRTCPGCTEFAVAIPRRRADMLVLYPPLPAAGAAALLANITGAGAGHGSGGAGLILGGGAAKGVGATISVKVAAAAGAAAIATAGVGAVAILHPAAPARPASAATHESSAEPHGSSAATHESSAATHGSGHPVTPSLAGTGISPAAGFSYRPGRSTRHGAVSAANPALNARNAGGHARNGHGAAHAANPGSSAAHEHPAAGHGRGVTVAPGRSTAGHGKPSGSPAIRRSKATVHRKNVVHARTRPRPHKRVRVKPTKHVRHEASTTTKAKRKTQTATVTTQVSATTPAVVGGLGPSSGRSGNPGSSSPRQSGGGASANKTAATTS